MWPLPFQVASPRAIEALQAPEDAEAPEVVDGEDAEDAEGDVEDAEPGEYQRPKRIDPHNSAACLMTGRSQNEDAAWQACLAQGLLFTSFCSSEASEVPRP